MHTNNKPFFAIIDKKFRLFLIMIHVYSRTSYLPMAFILRPYYTSYTLACFYIPKQPSIILSPYLYQLPSTAINAVEKCPTYIHKECNPAPIFDYSPKVPYKHKIRAAHRSAHLLHHQRCLGLCCYQSCIHQRMMQGIPLSK